MIEISGLTRRFGAAGISDVSFACRIAARAGAVLTELRPQGDNLEDLFFTLTAPNREEAA